MEHLFFDVLIIGSGAAGLRAAIAARQKGLDVCVISKQAPGKGSCTILSAGVFAGTQENTSPDHHMNQTLQAGRGINQRELVKTLVDEGPSRLRELVQWGINGEFHDGYLFCKGRAPYLGREIVRCLLKKNETLGTRFIGGLTVVGLKRLEGAFGVLASAAVLNKWFAIAAKALILATGGAAALYLRHDNPKRLIGNGYSLALEAGAVLQDMEFVQFYPLGLAEPGFPPFLVPPRLADCGQLRNARDQDILEKYDIREHPAAEKARDQLSRALFLEVYKENTEVFLDLRKVSEEKWHGDPFSAATRHILGERYGAAHRPVRVAPMAHHCMGGVCIDSHGATTVQGLFACGEVTGGLHGANRMGGNALTETLVFGSKAGQAAAAWATASNGALNDTMLKGFTSLKSDSKPGVTCSDASMRDLCNILWKECGIIRNQHGLERALSLAELVCREALQHRVETLSGARAAALIIQAALKRKESRGAHFREDFPNQDDENWCGHLQVRLPANSQQKWRFHPITP